MSKITSAKNYEQFAKECRFFFFKDIYENDWTGKERYIIASDRKLKRIFGVFVINICCFEN